MNEQRGEASPAQECHAGTCRHSEPRLKECHAGVCRGKIVPLLQAMGKALSERNDLALALDRAGIATRMGLHCAAAAHRSLGTLETGGTLRLSPGPFTGEGEIDEAVGAISTYMKECK